jgi:hypothetical protein
MAKKTQKSLVVAKPKTGPQSAGVRPTPNGGIAYGSGQMSGFPLVPPGNYNTYELMSSNPTLVLVRSIVGAPIRRNTWTWLKKKETPQQWLNFCHDTCNRLRTQYVRDALRSLEYEMAAFEIIWARANGMTVIDRLKVLADYPRTKILTDDGGNITGLENKGYNRNWNDSTPTVLKPPNFVLYRNDPTVKFFYGQSRYEGCRVDWSNSTAVSDKLAKYLGKIAGIVLQCHYPDGNGLDASGASRPNFWLAEDLLYNVGEGRSVALPNKFASFLSGDSNLVTSANLEKALASAGKSDWVLSAFDPGGTDYSNGFLATLAYYDKRMFRGFGRAERTGLEATSGGIGQSDAGTHSDTGLLDSELIDDDLAIEFSQQAIDAVLVQNYGPNAKGAVWVEPAPLNDTTVQTATALLTAAMTSPVLVNLVAPLLDWNKMIEDASMPLATSVMQAVSKAILAAAAAAKMPQAQAGVQDQMDEMRRMTSNGRH